MYISSSVSMENLARFIANQHVIDDGIYSMYYYTVLYCIPPQTDTHTHTHYEFHSPSLVNQKEYKRS